MRFPTGSGVAVLAVIMLATSAHEVRAQVTTASIRGHVSAADGTAMAESEVKLINHATGAQKEATTNADGDFAFTGLEIGGPYEVSATSIGFKPAIEVGITLSAGRTRDVALTLELQEDVIEVKGSALPRNTSSRTVITTQDIEAMPSITRDPKDLIRRSADADVEGSTLSIGGVNNRFNSITVDGIREDDDFGLNSSGYPTGRSPISLSAIQELSIESAPFDVRYSKFVGGNVNIITKSGTNDIHGEAFMTYSSSALEGSHIGDNKLPPNSFKEFRYGATVGGPIVKDKVHFLLSVEGLDAKTPVDAGPAGSGAVNVTNSVTAQELAMAQALAKSVYGFNAGVPSQSLTETDLKLLAKVDWEINNRHRMVVSYQLTRGTDDSAASSSASQLSLTSAWYNTVSTLNAFSVRLFSDWSDKLSTQLTFNGKLVSAIPTPLNGDDFASIQIHTPESGTINFGPDPNHQTNILDDDLLHWQAEANYLSGRNLITAGAEVDFLHIKNEFVPDTLGAAVYPSLDAFGSKMPSQLSYDNAVDLNPVDASAKWNAGTFSLYAQDALKATSRLNVTGGLRYEVYAADNDIAPNPYFYAKYGFSNTASLNGRSILMPRLGLSYLATDDLNLHVGGGLYSGGSPTVWSSNSYSNDGVRLATVVSTNPSVIDGFDGRNTPQAVTDLLKMGNGNVNALDPNFKVPSSWKIGTGADWSVLKGAVLKVNYTFSKTAEGVTWEDLRRNLSSLPDNEPVGTTVDGRPEYDLTSYNVHRGYDMLLTNTKEGYGHVFTLSAEKTFPFGLYVAGTYAYEHVLEVNPGDSSVAASNYGLVAVTDPQHPSLAVSNYERPNRFTLTAQYSHKIAAHFTDNPIWSQMKTGFGLFAEARSGQPYSWTFADANFGTTLGRIFGEDTTFAGRDRDLFYVPKGDGSDVTLNGITQAQFDKFLQQTGLAKYAGQIAPRNAFISPWYKHVDMRLYQDLPNPFKGHRARLTFDFVNIGNLLDSHWGRLQAAPFPYANPAVNVAIDPTTNKYVYSNLRPANSNVTDILSSVWRMSLGIMYDF